MTEHGARTRRALIAASLAGGIASPALLKAAPARRWRCVTSWPRNLPGPGVSARRLAERITAMSEGVLTIEVFAAGEIVPALQTLDAVSTGTVEMAHTASIFWSGKLPAAPLFTTAPFGLDPMEHLGWLQNGGGQALWDELYAPFGVKPLLGGNTGPSAAGWFRREIKSPGDFQGLRIRSTGLGAEVYTALGATALAIPPGETYAALERGVIDAVELLAPANDLPLGFHRIAPFYMFPGFNKPNGASEVLIARPVWEALAPSLRAIIEAACQSEHALAITEASTLNYAALVTILESGTMVKRLPDAVLNAARQASDVVMDRLAARNELSGRILRSMRESALRERRWAGLTRLPAPPA